MSTVPLTFANYSILKYIYPNSLAHLIDELKQAAAIIEWFYLVVSLNKAKENKFP